ncbi:molybdate ABC transporter substrate-binding protein [Calycomorphotria hydatis]|uniref:Binding protein n=1 Tax=Calycomorphotria hydatis TaxID=2528027 RepID=A0A517T9M6_9PLAN|nr:molybdate ABC transporter substrate-binding protein [Calycomorphotria hydatis]QDT65075.1 Putative binding protein precursor [Calycomorphotria hydatis]
MNSPAINLFLPISLLLPVLLFLVLATGTGCDRTPAKPSLVVYCAAGMRRPMEALAAEFQEKEHIPVELQFGGSNTLLSQIEISRTGDLYLAADSSYVLLAQKKRLASQNYPVATITPVIVLNDAVVTTVESIADLIQSDLRIAFANPDAAAIGKICRTSLQDHGLWDAFMQRIQDNGVTTPNVMGVATAVEFGSVDAGIVWDAVASQYLGMRVVQDPILAAEHSTIEITLLTNSKHPELALQFAEFVSLTRNDLFAEHGFHSKIPAHSPSPEVD